MTASLEAEFAKFREQLVLGGMLHSSSIVGANMWSADFERLVGDVSRAFGRHVVPSAIETFRFAPTVPRSVVDRSGYADSFPHLVGIVSPPVGTDAGFLTGQVAMPGAACQPVFAAMTGSRVKRIRSVWAEGYVFRNEPSSDPMRMMSFRQSEGVFVGGQDDVREHLVAAFSRCAAMLSDWEIRIESVEASDSFAGRLASFRVQLQLEAASKRELVHRMWTLSDHPQTALASRNFHGMHFADEFDIRQSDGTTASTGCIGLGLERTALALLRVHGVDRLAWPRHVHDALSPLAEVPKHSPILEGGDQ